MKRIAGMATMPGREVQLLQAVATIAPQVDELWVWCNGFDVPPWPVQDTAGVHPIAGVPDRGDAGKFCPAWAASTPRDAYVFTVDDDIVYPPDYADRLVAAYDALVADVGGRLAVGVHGAQWRTWPVTDFSYGRVMTHCLRASSGYTPQHYLGTGTLMFRQGDIDLKPEHFENGKMADVWFGLQAQLQRLPLRTVPRDAGWITVAKPEPAYTLWNRMQREGDAMQLEAISRVDPWVLR